MKKLYILFCFFITLLILISGCGNTDDKSAEEHGKKFIEDLYSVDDPNIDYESMSVESLIDAQNEFSSYLTENEFEDLANKRLLIRPMETASERSNAISVQNIEFEKYVPDDADSDSFYFDHFFTLLFKDQEGNEVEKLDVNGQMTIEDTGDGWEIDRYYDDKIRTDKLN